MKPWLSVLALMTASCANPVEQQVQAYKDSRLATILPCEMDRA